MLNIFRRAKPYKELTVVPTKVWEEKLQELEVQRKILFQALAAMSGLDQHGDKISIVDDRLIGIDDDETFGFERGTGIKNGK